MLALPAEEQRERAGILLTRVKGGRVVLRVGLAWASLLVRIATLVPSSPLFFLVNMACVEEA